MVEVFKTNVDDEEMAKWLLGRLRHFFRNYELNFDLEDCDKILRVECSDEDIRTALLLKFLNNSGIKAEVLQDEIQHQPKL